MKRFLVFAGLNFYAAGGWLDFFKDFDDPEKAKKFAKKKAKEYNWAHVVDTETMEILKEDSVEGEYCGSFKHNH